jgi:Ca2+-binding RTX toxin-like protein
VGEGNDTVFASASYALTPGQSIEVLDVVDRNATSALSLTGNVVAQTIIGNAGNNVLNGGGGADIYYGLGGNDTYMVSSASEIVFEAAGQGTDTIYTMASYALTAGQEIEVLDVFDRGATTALNLTGNGLAQTIIGNAGNNVFNGAGGADIYYGLGGNDAYFVGSASEVVFEAAGQGTDTVFAMASYTLLAGQEIEVLDVFDRAGTTALNLTGNGIAQAVIGNAGANILNGAAGSDTLFGLGGADTFAFTTTLGAGNVDTLADFSVADDTIALDDAVFATIGALGALNANAFVTGTQAADATDRIIYNATTGQLLYDADGIGGVAAVQFATLNTGLAITAADFAVI